MENQPLIVNVDRLNGGVMIEFDDGKIAFYSAPVLYAALAQADLMTDEQD